MKKNSNSPNSLMAVFKSIINDKEPNNKNNKETLPPLIQGVKMKKSQFDSIYIEIDEMIPMQNSVSQMEYRFAENILTKLGIDCEEQYRIEITTDISELTRLIIFISRSKPRNL